MNSDRNFRFTNGLEIPVGTMFCIGRNYALHAKEMGGEVPAEPIVFLKPAQAYLPDGGEIVLPSFSNNIHHELELVVVIGEDCRNISPADAERYIAGYGIGLDLTLRDVQGEAKKKGEPWAVAKGFATSAPISRIIPKGEFTESDPKFDIILHVNGELRQKGNTADMERSVAELISYLSGVFGLRRGDCIFTGTPEGVSAIRAGDRIHAEIPGRVSLDAGVAL